MAADKSDLELTLEKIDKLQGELIKTQKFIKDANFDNIGQNLKTLLDTLVRSFIPHLASEIDFILKTSSFQKEFFVTDEQMNSSLCFPPIIINERDQFEIDIKEEDIIRDVYEYGNEDPFQDFQGQEKQNFSGIAEQWESQQNFVSSKVENFSADGAYIISGTSYQEKLKAVSPFIKKCVSLPGVKDGLGKFRNSSDTGYNCPFCEAGSLKIKDCWTFMRHLLLIHADSDLSDLVPLPFVFQQNKGPLTADNYQNSTHKCPHCSNSYNNETSFQWHLNFGHGMDLNEQLAHETQTPFIITCSSDKESLKSFTEFSRLCLKVPGMRERLIGLKNSNGNFICPLCFPEKIILSPKVFDLMRHIISRDHATLIPLPYIRQESSDRKILECESKSEESSDEEEQELNNGELNKKMLSNFTKKCLAIQGMKDRLGKFRNSSDTGYDCPSCPQGTPKIRDTWKLMEHIVRMHKDSDLIPLPYIKLQPSSNTSKKRKRSKSPDEWSSDEELSTSSSFEESNNALNELIQGYLIN